MRTLVAFLLATVSLAVAPTLLAQSNGSLTIAVDMVGNSAMYMFFSGDLGYFNLDGFVPATGDDPRPSSKTFEVAPGVYTIHQKLHGNYVLRDIACDGESVADVTTGTLTVTVTADSHTTCTFVNDRRSIVRAVVYRDSNRNGVFNAGEPGLKGWRVVVYDMLGNPQFNADGPDPEFLTNAQGKEGANNIPPGDYTICQEMRAGWFNTQPASVHPTYGQPCYEATVAPGRIVEVYFGNTDVPLSSAAQVSAESGVIERDAPLDRVDDEAWLNAPLQGAGLFMPLVMD